MNYLVDTNVLSEMRKASQAHQGVKNWAAGVNASALYVSVITLFELELGTRRIARRDSIQGATLRSWLENYVLVAFAGRILPVDLTTALRCAALHVPDPRSYRDALIAATALVHDMTVITRNVSDFRPTGATVLNPWDP